MLPSVDQAQTLFDRLTAQATATRQTPDPDAVHDLRVAIRRFTQALSVYPSLFRTRDSRKLRERLKELMSQAGDVRDADITAKLVAKQKSGAEILLKKLDRHRSAGVKALKAGLRQWLAAGETLPLKRKVPRLSVEEVAAKQLAPALKEFFAHGKQAATGKLRGKELHEFRIAAKKFRYTLELFQPVAGPAIESRIENLRAVQTALGDINDCRAARDLLKDLGAGDEVRDAIRKKQRKRTEEFQRLWGELYARRKEWRTAKAAPVPIATSVAAKAKPATPASTTPPAVPKAVR